MYDAFIIYGGEKMPVIFDSPTACNTAILKQAANTKQMCLFKTHNSLYDYAIFIRIASCLDILDNTRKL